MALFYSASTSLHIYVPFSPCLFLSLRAPSFLFPPCFLACDSICQKAILLSPPDLAVAPGCTSHDVVQRLPPGGPNWLQIYHSLTNGLNSILTILFPEVLWGRTRSKQQQTSARRHRR
jgi:hypothetical protein